MQNKKLLLLCLLVGCIGYMSCSKDGTAGPKGDPGTANVIHSPWINLNLAFDKTDSIYYQTITAPGITQNILDSGVVLSYLGISSNGQTTVVNAATYFQEEDYNVGSITLYSYYAYTGVQYRYVIIPGGVAGGRSKGLLSSYTKKDLEAMPYDDVIALLKRSGIDPDK